MTRGRRLVTLAFFVATLVHAQSDDLIFAASSGDLSAVNELLKSGADVNAHKSPPIGTPNFNRDSKDAETALYVASENGHLEIVKALLAAGADPNVACCSGFTPLFWAVQNGKLEMVKALLAAKANPSPPKTSAGRTPMLAALVGGRLEIARALVEAGANVNTGGVTPLMLAVEKRGPGSLELVQAILAAHADVNTSFDDLDNWNAKSNIKIGHLAGTTALGIAAASGSVDIVQALLAPGIYANVNARQHTGNTPLTIAAANGRADVVRLLLAAKADVNVKLTDGSTALMLTLRNNHPEIAEILRSAGAVE